MKRVKINKDCLEIKWRTPTREEFQCILERIKTLSNRVFDPDKRIWICPDTKGNREILTKLGFFVPKEDKTVLIPPKKVEIRIKNFPGILKELRHYQIEGINFIEQNKGRVLLADDMGLGKTIQALTWLYHNRKNDVFPAVIVCPASAKFVWEKEIAESLEEKPSRRIIHGRKSGFFHISTDIVIINYDILKDRVDEILRMNPKTLIGDEIHACKNTTTQRTKAFIKLGKVCKHIIALSGTPLEIRPMELFPVINLLRPDIFPDHHKYGQEFCEGHHDGYGWRYTGASNIPKLHNILTSTFMIRRKKSEVLKELPPKQRAIVPFEIDNREDYESIEKDVISWILENESYHKAVKASRAEEFVKTRKLMTAAFLGKQKAVLKWIEDFLETDEKLIIFFATHYALDSVYEKFKDISVKIDGRVPSSHREGIVRAFQENNKIKLFCGEIVSAGQAITLTASSNVAFVEYLFNPAKHVQAEDRSNRLGQRNAVTVHYLVATETIEEVMIKVLQKRMEVSEGILDGRTSDSDVFEEVIAQIAQRKEKPNKFTRVRQRKLGEHNAVAL